MSVPPVLFVTGPPASGKTFIAATLADQLALPLLARDGIKEVLYDTLGVSDVAWSRTLGRASFALLYHALESQLRAGQAVIVEANFRPAHDSPRLRGLHRRYPFEPLEFHCTAAVPTLLERYAARAATRHPGHADADRLDEVARAVENGMHGALDLGEVVVLDTTDFGTVDLDGLVAAARAHLGRACAAGPHVDASP